VGILGLVGLVAIVARPRLCLGCAAPALHHRVGAGTPGEICTLLLELHCVLV
jgi:hypothetical protein